MFNKFKAMKETKEEMYERFWNVVEKLLSRKGLSFTDVTKATDIKYNTLIGWRNNKRLPDLYSALAISEFLDVPIESLCLPDRFGRTTIQPATKLLSSFIEEQDEEAKKLALDALNESNSLAEKFNKLFEDIVK